MVKPAQPHNFPRLDMLASRLTVFETRYYTPSQARATVIG
jgi:hypothetical protein